MKDWLIWLGRGAERDRAYARLEAARQQYGTDGERIITLSQRTDRARASAGSTKRSFEYVENVFLKATDLYTKVGERLEAIEGGLSQGKVGDFAGLEALLKQLPGALDELERHLANWEATWKAVPQRIDAAQQSLAELRQQVERLAAQVGAPLPLTERLAGLEQYLEKVRRTHAEGNPIEANHQLDDLQIARKRVDEEVERYSGGAGALAQAEADLAQVRQAAEGREDLPPEAVGALAAAQAQVARLRPALAAGKFEGLQQDLLQLQRQLAVARTHLR